MKICFSLFLLLTAHILLSQDTIYYHACPGSLVTLYAEGGTLYEWEDGTKADSLRVTANVGDTYEVTILDGQDNLVVNGNFSDGNSGFVTGYDYYDGSGTLWEGDYWVGPNAQTVHSGFRGFDHTSGSGTDPDNFYVVNGASNAGSVVWEQTIEVEPNANYAFSCWTTNVAGYVPAELQFSINGIQIGDVFSTVNYMDWSQFYEEWSSLGNVSATITLLNQNTSMSGNDFGIDDISFQKISKKTVIYKILDLEVGGTGWDDTAVLCSGDSLVLDAEATGATYEWSEAGFTGSSLTVKDAGVYSVTVSQNGCRYSDFIDVSINAGIDVELGKHVVTDVPVTLDAGAGFSSYEWSNGTGSQTLEVTETGKYMVTVSKDGCSDFDEIEVFIYEPITVELVDTVTICAGDSALLKPSGSGERALEQVLHLPLNNTLKDKDGSYDAVNYSAVSTTDRIGNSAGAYQFNGIDQYLSIDYDKAYNPANFSFGAFVKFGDLSQSTGSIIANTERSGFSLLINSPKNNGYLRASVKTVDGYISLDCPLSNFNTDDWFHLFVTFNDSLMALYAGGIKVAEAEVSSAFVPSPTRLFIGAEPDPSHNPGWFFNGCIDDVRVYSEGLTETEVAVIADDRVPVREDEYDYQWDTGETADSIFAKTEGEYILTAKLGTQSAQDTAYVKVLTMPELGIDERYEFCKGSSVTIVGGNSDATYEWADGVIAGSYTIDRPDEYTVSVTANGCQTSVEYTVIEKPVPVFELGEDREVCENSTVTFDASVSDASANYEWSNGSISSEIDAALEGDYSVSVTLDGCSYADTVNLTFIPYPEVDTLPDYSLCGPKIFTVEILNPNNYTILWNGLTESNTYQSQGVTETITLSVANGDCVVYDTAEVVINEIPVVDLGGDFTICKGDVAKLDATATDATYQWQDGSTDSVFEVSEGGTYSVTVTQNSCEGEDEIVISELAYPVFDTLPDMQLCDGDVYRYQISASGYDIEWSDGSVDQSYEASQTETVIVRVANGECTVYDTAQVVVNDFPVVELGADKEICEGESQSLVLSLTEAEFEWSTGASASKIDVSAEGTYSVSVTQNGCETSDEITITVYPLPVVDLGEDFSICENSSAEIDAQNPGATYLWSDNSSSQILTVDEAGTYEVTVTKNGCKASSSVIVSETAIPQITLSDATICEGENHQFDATYSSTSHIQYTWSNGLASAEISPSEGGTYTVTVSDNECEYVTSAVLTVLEYPVVDLEEAVVLCQGSGINETHTFDLSGAGESFNWHDGSSSATYLASATEAVYVTVANGTCETKAQTTVSVVTVPDLDLGDNQIICENEVLLLDPAVSLIGLAYEWSDGSTSETLSVNQTGTYSVTVSNQECKASSSIDVEVVPVPSEPVVAGELWCTNDDADPVMIALGENVKWYADNQLSVEKNEGEIFVPEHRQAGTYQYFVTQSEGGCESGPVEVALEIVDPDDSGLEIFGDEQICEYDDQVAFFAVGGEKEYKWYISDDIKFDGQTGEAIMAYFEEAGVDTVHLLTKDYNGCYISEEKPVYVASYPAVDFSWKQTEKEGFVEYTNESLQANIEQDDYKRTIGLVDLQWKLSVLDSAGFYISADKRFAEAFYEYGYYSVGLLVENEFGCRDSVRKEIFVDIHTGLYMPTAFSPSHASEKVAMFKPIGINLAEYEVFVYDNWGNRVWYSNELDENGSPVEGWDGTYEGIVLKPDVYTWKVKAVFEDGKKWTGDEFGTVVLLR